MLFVRSFGFLLRATCLERSEIVGVLAIGQQLAKAAHLLFDSGNVLEQPVDVAAGRKVQEVQSSARDSLDRTVHFRAAAESECRQ